MFEQQKRPLTQVFAMLRMISDQMPEHSIAREFGLVYEVETDEYGNYTDVRYESITKVRGNLKHFLINIL